MSDIQFTCPKCGHSLIVDESGVGMSVPCPECNEPLVIPAPEEQTAAQDDNAPAGVDTVSAENTNTIEPPLDAPISHEQAPKRSSVVRGAACVLSVLFSWLTKLICLIGWLVIAAFRLIIVAPLLKAHLLSQYIKIGAQAYRNKIDLEKGAAIRDQIIAIDQEAEVAGSLPIGEQKPITRFGLIVARMMGRIKKRRLLAMLGRELAGGEVVNDAIYQCVRRATRSQEAIKRTRAIRPKIAAAKNFVMGLVTIGATVATFNYQCNADGIKASSLQVAREMQGTPTSFVHKEISHEQRKGEHKVSANQFTTNMLALCDLYLHEMSDPKTTEIRKSYIYHELLSALEIFNNEASLVLRLKQADNNFIIADDIKSAMGHTLTIKLIFQNVHNEFVNLQKGEEVEISGIYGSSGLKIYPTEAYGSYSRSRATPNLTSVNVCTVEVVLGATKVESKMSARSFNPYSVMEKYIGDYVEYGKVDLSSGGILGKMAKLTDNAKCELIDRLYADLRDIKTQHYYSEYFYTSPTAFPKLTSIQLVQVMEMVRSVAKALAESTSSTHVSVDEIEADFKNDKDIVIRGWLDIPGRQSCVRVVINTQANISMTKIKKGDSISVRGKPSSVYCAMTGTWPLQIAIHYTTPQIQVFGD